MARLIALALLALLVGCGPRATRITGAACALGSASTGVERAATVNTSDADSGATRALVLASITAAVCLYAAAAAVVDSEDRNMGQAGQFTALPASRVLREADNNKDKKLDDKPAAPARGSASNDKPLPGVITNASAEQVRKLAERMGIAYTNKPTALVELATLPNRDAVLSAWVHIESEGQ